MKNYSHLKKHEIFTFQHYLLDMYRPVAKIGGKESEDAIADAMNRFFLETADLEDTVVVLDSGKSIKFHHVVLPTMLDGKCRFVLFNFE